MALAYQPPAMAATKTWYPALQFAVATRFLRLTVGLLLCGLLLSAAALKSAALVEAARITPAATPPAHRPAQPVQHAQPAPLTPHAAAVATVAPPTACTPFGAVATPSALSMTSPGLQQFIETPTFYVIHGANASEIASQLRRCAPVSSDGIFSGATSYWLGTRYSYRLTPADTCQLADISVALHVTQVLPVWQDGSLSALRAKWDAYERNLATHENGHAAIDIAQAQALLTELTALPDMPCDTIAGTAKTVTSSRLAAVDHANETYDVTTGHGATQGASW